jgi:precorrin-6A/cobalt-precorrin-6A reductase
MTVLLLGGTTEARLLAEQLVAQGMAVVTSLAGSVAAPPTDIGRMRIGGFGGIGGLVSYLRDQGVQVVVDATHPFAAQISAHAAQACAEVGIPLLRLSRPGWGSRAEASDWHWVDSLAAAKLAVESVGSRVFLSIGRQELVTFADWTDRYVLARVIDPPEFLPPASWEILRSRGPFRVADELALLSGREIDVLVTKDSGGEAAVAKLDAAGQLGLRVVMVRRPPLVGASQQVATVSQAAAWVFESCR